MTALSWGLAAAASTAAITAAHRAGRLPGGSARWARINHAGHPVTLCEGVALSAGIAAPLLIADPPAALAVLGSAVAGGIDDLAGATETKGLSGHLAALRAGHLTTGVLKIGLLAVLGLAACAWSDQRKGRLGLHSLTGGALVAGSANLANLFDLRPGRALKVGLAVATPMALTASPAAAALVGAGLTVLPADLRGESMLGDTGANPLGAAAGLAAAQALGPAGRLVALLGVTGLTLLSEKVSFSRVIEDTPALRRLDAWGRP